MASAALMTCWGVAFGTLSPSSFCAASDREISLSARENTPPPAEISALS